MMKIAKHAVMQRVYIPPRRPLKPLGGEKVKGKNRYNYELIEPKGIVFELTPHHRAAKIPKLPPPQKN